VLVDPDGKAQDVAVIASSGSSSLDQIVVGVARTAQYTPAMHACKAVAGDYMYAVEFFAW
jgi:TonB family protein